MPKMCYRLLGEVPEMRQGDKIHGEERPLQCHEFFPDGQRKWFVGAEPGVVQGMFVRGLVAIRGHDRGDPGQQDSDLGA